MTLCFKGDVLTCTGKWTKVAQLVDRQARNLLADSVTQRLLGQMMKMIVIVIIVIIVIIIVIIIIIIYWQIKILFRRK